MTRNIRYFDICDKIMSYCVIETAIHFGISPKHWMYGIGAKDASGAQIYEFDIVRFSLTTWDWDLDCYVSSKEYIGKVILYSDQYHGLEARIKPFVDIEEENFSCEKGDIVKEDINWHYSRILGNELEHQGIIEESLARL